MKTLTCWSKILMKFPIKAACTGEMHKQRPCLLISTSISSIIHHTCTMGVGQGTDNMDNIITTCLLPLPMGNVYFVWLQI
mmetsp:Transcript_18677/g.37876  ORF Transcript_18677/g.37876 Transcript_18677/m.37876 type:complete len:80 (+) Transcript_18677:102-341(+)